MVAGIIVVLFQDPLFGKGLSSMDVVIIFKFGIPQSDIYIFEELKHLSLVEIHRGKCLFLF